MTLADTSAVLFPDDLVESLMSQVSISTFSLAASIISSIPAALTSPMTMNAVFFRSITEPIFATTTSLETHMSFRVSMESGSMSKVRSTDILPLMVCSRLWTTPMMLAFTVDIGSRAATS